MKHVFKLTAIAAVLAFSGAASADPAETKGGITVKTEDGRFEGKLGGRIQFDGYLFGDREVDGVKTPPRPTSTTDFRRARLTLTGKAYGWEYKFEEDFASSNAQTVDEREMWIATGLAGGKFTIGQFKPFRSMEELTSSNEITMMERPFTSATGIYNGRQFQQGLGWQTNGDNYTFGLSGFTLRNDATPRNEGVGFSGRGTYAPIVSDGSVVHLGLSYSSENINMSDTPADLAAIAPHAALAGRRSPNVALGTVTGNSTADTFGVELATVQGPFYVQAEYAQMTLGQVTGSPDQDITAYYVMASWHLTGESKPYKKANGVFGSAKPSSDGGAWELAARYEFAENKDLAAEPEVTSMTVGVNYYVNPNVRFMLDYVMGEQEIAAGTKTELDQLSGRIQFGF